MDINTVVVGYDGSDSADRALDAALAVLNAGGALHLVSAAEAPSAREIRAALAQVPDEFRSEIDLMSEPRGQLEAAAERASEGDVLVTPHLLDDDPASAILALADDVNADMIVVGSRGLGRASRVVRGSVSTKIAMHSQRDFMVIH